MLLDSFDPMIDLNSCEPVIKYLPGWSSGISTCRSWNELPENAKAYVSFIEEQLDHEIQFVSVGAERDQYIMKGEWL